MIMRASTVLGSPEERLCRINCALVLAFIKALFAIIFSNRYDESGSAAFTHILAVIAE
jgi:hypothetical protein